MLYDANYKNLFLIFSDASNTQLGCHILLIKDNINFTSMDEVLKATYNVVVRKLNSYQVNYTVIDKELLSIVDTLLEYKTILYGAIIYVYTDHNNLTHYDTSHASAHV